MNKAELESKLSKSIDFLKTELNQIRTGRASPSLIEDITVDAYDSKMKVKELGSISLLDNQTLAVTPWDKSILGNIMKAIRESNLGLNPVDDTDRVRIAIPPLTEERRKDFVKVVSTKAEECKQTIRNIRQEAMKDIDKSFTDKLISEDEKFSLRDDVEKVVKRFVETADEVGETKKSDLMRI